MSRCHRALGTRKTRLTLENWVKLFCVAKRPAMCFAHSVWLCSTLQMSHKCCFKLFWFWWWLWKYKATRSAIQQAVSCPNNTSTSLASGFSGLTDFREFSQPLIPKSHFWDKLQKSQHFQNSSCARDIEKSKINERGSMKLFWKTLSSWDPTSPMSLIYTFFSLSTVSACLNLFTNKKSSLGGDVWLFKSRRSLCITPRIPAGFPLLFKSGFSIEYGFNQSINTIHSQIHRLWSNQGLLDDLIWHLHTVCH